MGCHFMQETATAGMLWTRDRQYERLLVSTSPLPRYRAPPGQMSDTIVKPRTKVRPKTQRPRLHKVILLNDDFTPREFVVRVLRAVFSLGEEQAYRIMITAHSRGLCVVAVFTKDVAETKATEATQAGRRAGYPLLFATEPEQ